MLVLPHTIGAITLHRKIGTGSVAESYLATQDGKPVLARRVLAFIARDPGRLAAIEARVEELSGFRHPSLVQVHGIVRENGETCIVEEFVEGVSLERLIAAARTGSVQLPPNLFLHIAVQICNALEALHSRPSATADSVLHLGIKPGAVFLGVDGKVVVGSFGLTRSPSTLPQGGSAGSVVLRMEYLSPEQTHADQMLTPASDLFSLGAVLYELLTLESLFRADSNLQTIHRIRRGEVTSQLLKIKSRMPGLDKLLYRALSVNPKHRYQRAFVLREDLRGLMSGYSFAAVNEEARSWLAPLFAEGARALDLLATPTEVPLETPTLAPVPSVLPGLLVGLHDQDDGPGESETTDFGFFPAGQPEKSSPGLVNLADPEAARGLTVQGFPDPTASAAEAAPGPAPSTPASPPTGPRTSNRQQITLVALGDDEDAVPPVRDGGTLLPEQFSPETTAAWIANATAAPPPPGRPTVSLTPANASGPENTASFLPSEEPDNTAAHIHPPNLDPPSAFGEERTLTQTGTPGRPNESLPPPVAAPLPAPAPLLAPPLQSVPPLAGRRTVPPPVAPAPFESFEGDLYAPPPASRAPVLVMAAGLGLVAILACSGIGYGVWSYAVEARAERVAAAMKDAAPPLVQPSDDPAATMAGGAPATAPVAPEANPAEPVAASPAAPVASATPAAVPSPAPVAASPPTPAPAPVTRPPAQPEPVAAPVSRPVAQVQPPAGPVSRPSPPPPAPAPVSRPVAAVDRVSQPVAVSRPVAVAPPAPVSRPAPTPATLSVQPAADLADDTLSVGSSAVNLDALATDARSGRLRPDDAAVLAAIPTSDAGYTRAQALLLSNAQKKGDKAGTEQALNALFALPENGYNPQFLAADALFLVNSGLYDRALTRAQLAEKYWSRLPPSQSFAMRTQIYEVEAAAWQGKFYNSGGDQAALDNAIRGWQKYSDLVAEQSRADLQKNAQAQIGKLQDIKTRMQ